MWVFRSFVIVDMDFLEIRSVQMLVEESSSLRQGGNGDECDELRDGQHDGGFRYRDLFVRIAMNWYGERCSQRLKTYKGILVVILRLVTGFLHICYFRRRD